MKFSFFGLFGSPSNESDPQKKRLRSKRITLANLGPELDLLSQNKTGRNRFAITSNDTDCLYFLKNGNHFDLEFEALTREQAPYIAKLQQYCERNNIRLIMHSYGNKRLYRSDKTAPVIKLVTDFDRTATIALTTDIMANVFKNDANTQYSILT